MLIYVSWCEYLFVHLFYYLQDFGDVIPGHGGMMDRFDCQYLMATFVNVYIASFVRWDKPLIFTRATFREKLVSRHRAVNESDSCLLMRSLGSKLCVATRVDFVTIVSERLSVENKAKLSQLTRADFVTVAKLTHLFLENKAKLSQLTRADIVTIAKLTH